MSSFHILCRATKAVALALAIAATPAWGGVFSVTPVRIFMKSTDRAVAVTLVNEGDTEIALQAELYGWVQQADGVDQLVETEDMIFSPPIIRLAAQARQVVRLAMLKPADAGRQLTYRMIIREVPEAVAARNNAMEVPIALALNMPIFITPAAARREVACTALRTADQKLEAICHNTGTAYAQIREIELRRNGRILGRFEGGNYVLQGARKSIPLVTDRPVEAGNAELHLVFDDFKTQAFPVTLAQ